MSSEDIKNHHTITETLNKLKLLVEEAELWVQKQVPRVEDAGGGKVRCGLDERVGKARRKGGQ